MLGSADRGPYSLRREAGWRTCEGVRVRPIWRSMSWSKSTLKSETRRRPQDRHGRYAQQQEEKTVVLE
jgi:hypothetical protein